MLCSTARNDESWAVSDRKLANLGLEAAHDYLCSHLACDLAGTVSAHAVGQYRDPGFGIGHNAVLVELAHAASVGNGGYFDEISATCITC